MATETSASMLEKHPYSTLAPNEIRLIKIIPGNFHDPIKIIMQSVDLRTEPEYDALSYVWHPQYCTPDPVVSLEPAIITNYNEFPINLSANLDSAIRHLRHSPNGSDNEDTACQTLWIDALSINQQSISERNHQVGLMSKIYSSARQVLIWLDSAFNGSDFVMDVLRTGNLASEDINRFMESLELIIRSEWFGRVWIAQELTLSKRDPVLYVGLMTIGWELFSLGVELVVATISGDASATRPLSPAYLNCLAGDGFQTTLWEGDNVVPNAVVARAELVQNLMDMRNAGPNAMFSKQLLRTLHLRSSDPRDKVFGLLGFSSFRNHKYAIIPDYEKSTERVFAEAAAVIMREDFCSYVDFELWKYQYRRFGGGEQHAWAPNLELIGLSRTPELDLVPNLDQLRNALSASHGQAPFINFEHDFSTFSTVGRMMGRVVAFSELTTRALVSGYTPFFPIYEYLDKVKVTPDFQAMASILLAPLGWDDYERGNLTFVLSLLYHQHKRGHKAFPFQYQEYPALERMLEGFPNRTQFFMTDTGVMGLAQIPHHIPRYPKNCLIAGLFGINLPFLLHPLEKEREYNMLCIAHLGNHELGDDYVKKLKPETDWKDIVDDGEMEIFTFS